MPAVEPTDASMKQCAQLLNEGKLVAFPTETVYGLGANALNADACKAIFTVKQRDARDPLIVHVLGKDDAVKLQQLSPPTLHVFSLLTEKFWPGPLTIVGPASADIPSVVTGGSGCVGVRAPRGIIARQLLEAAQLPIAAPSANRFGHVSPTQAQHVLDDLADSYHSHFKADLQVLDGGSTECGIESTVVRLQCDDTEHQNACKNVTVVVLRRGVVTEEEIATACTTNNTREDISISVKFLQKAVKIPESDSTENSTPPPANTTKDTAPLLHSPGQLLKHYAPSKPTFLVAHADSKVLGHSGKFGVKTDADSTVTPIEKAVVIDFGTTLQYLKDTAAQYFNLSAEGDVQAANHRLFATLRQAENVQAADVIIVVVVGETQQETTEPPLKKTKVQQAGGAAAAINDRLFRAATGKQAQICNIE
eukprot:TRINITY_DN7312_c0_g1_i1.p1 TRINITY_DN7312_c0_g1~~TRINITY_DN7312_c0_g1_i1.p1  ORF type:complete len:422 (+),score=61.08 TRINITY_DN7312_c0_g1_i1:63-1328(+)